MASKPEEVNAALKELEHGWINAEMPPTFVQNVPDGSYQVSVMQPKIGFSETSKRLQITWPLKIMSGNLKNQIITKFEGMQTPENLGYVKQTLKRLGLPDAASPAQLPAVLEKAEGILCEIKVVTKNEFSNIYFQKVIGPSDVAPARNML